MARWACAFESRSDAGIRIGGVHLSGAAWRAWMTSSDLGHDGQRSVTKAQFDLPPGTEDDAIRWVREVLLHAFASQGFGSCVVHELRTDKPSEAVRILVEAGAHDVVKALVLERPAHEALAPSEVERLAGYVPQMRRDPVKALRQAKRRKAAQAVAEKAEQPKKAKKGWIWSPSRSDEV